ncbi:MAG TPA: sigma-70 family RNA polymerase sigma factor [Pirellulales bacterium]|nr:sigma-70 family RNA polymerase sigma factor [Pirellulales bacterium]
MTSDLYREVSRVVCAAARRTGRITVDDAEDLTQTVLLNLWSGRDKIRSPERLLALVYRAARNAWLNSCRSRSNYAACLARYREIVPDVSEAMGDAHHEELAILWQCVAELDPRIADAIQRHFCDGQSYATIGLALGVSNCTAHKLVHRGLDELKASLAGEIAAEEDRPPQAASEERMRRRPKKSHRQRLAISRKADIHTRTTATPAANSLKRRGLLCPD